MIRYAPLAATLAFALSACSTDARTATAEDCLADEIAGDVVATDGTLTGKREFASGIASLMQKAEACGYAADLRKTEVIPEGLAFEAELRLREE